MPAAHLQQVRGHGLQHEHVVEAHGRTRQPRRPQSEREVTRAQHPFLDQISDLHQHLERDTGGQRLRQPRMLVGAGAGQTDEIIREGLQVLGDDGSGVERRENRIVQHRGVIPRDLELRDLQGLQQLRHFRQTTAERLQRGVDAVELEPVRTLPGNGIARRPGGRKEPLRLQYREHVLDPATTRRVEPAARTALRTAARQQLRHRPEVEHAVMRRPERRLQGRRRKGGLGSREIRAQDVLQADDQLLDARARGAHLLLLDRPPRVAHEARGQRRIAVGHFTVDRQRRACPARVAREGLIRARPERRHGLIPQLQQRATGTVRREPADLAFDLQCPPAQALARYARRRSGTQRGVDGVGQRLGEIAIPMRKDHREVVAQRIEIAVCGHQRRTQAGERRRLRLVVSAATRQMKDDLCPELTVHAVTARR